MKIIIAQELLFNIPLSYILINDKKIPITFYDKKQIIKNAKLINFEVIHNIVYYIYEVNDLPEEIKEKIIIDGI